MPISDSTRAAGDPFHVLGLEQRFDIDLGEVTARHAERVAQAGADPARVAALDAARQTLLDPERRGDALLTLLGGPDPEQVGQIWAAQQQTIDRLRGEWADATARNDPAALAMVRQTIEAERQARLARVTTLFRGLRGRDNPVVQRDRRRDVRMELNALRDLRRIETNAGG